MIRSWEILIYILIDDEKQDSKVFISGHSASWAVRLILVLKIFRSFPKC